jgi:tetratricopeptide (TPR) repeat protein
MAYSGSCRAVLTAAAGVCAVLPAYGEKVLVYDENKGIVFVDKDKAGVAAPETGSEGRAGSERSGEAARGKIRRSKHDLHVDRKKDPPRLYFESGLEYYQNGDYENALKNLRHAAERMPREPKYRLWIGKTYRQLGKNDRMLAVLTELMERFPESDVADDALFEIAFYYQQSDHYDSAFQVYARLAEQYPFGVSFASGEDFLDIARDQRRRMRAEMVSTLKLLGHEGETLQDAYASFQEANGLPVDGRAGRETVRAIKKQHGRRFAEDDRRANEELLARERRKWLLVLGAVALASLLATAGARMRIGRVRRHIDTLRTTLEDLDTKAL